MHNPLSHIATRDWGAARHRRSSLRVLAKCASPSALVLSETAAQNELSVPPYCVHDVCTLRPLLSSLTDEMGAAHTVACPDAPQTRVTGFTLPERVISYPPASKSTTNYMEDRRRLSKSDCRIISLTGNENLFESEERGSWMTRSL